MKEFRTTLIWNSLKVKPCFGLVKTEWKKHFQNSSIFSVHKSGALLVAGSGRRKGEPHPCQDGPFWWCLNKACPACTHGPRCKVSAMQYQDAWGQTRARPFAIGECLWCIKSWLEWCWMVLPHFTIFKVTYLSPWHSLNCHCLFFSCMFESPAPYDPKQWPHIVNYLYLVAMKVHQWCCLTTYWILHHLGSPKYVETLRQYLYIYNSLNWLDIFVTSTDGGFLSNRTSNLQTQAAKFRLLNYCSFPYLHTHRIHVWYIYLHFFDSYGKCR